MTVWTALLLLIWTLAATGFMLHLDNEIRETRSEIQETRKAIGALARRLKEKGINV